MQYQHKNLSKIYSRKRFNIAFLNKKPRSHRNRKKIKGIMPVFMALLIALVTCFSVWNYINPIFETLCLDEAKAVATKITNEQTTKVMSKYNYDTFFTIEKDEKGNVQMITANVLKVNQVTSDIAIKIQEELEKNQNNKIYIASGSITGIRFLSGFGPKIGLNLACNGNVETNVRSEFVSQGVNQTIHRVYLDIKTNVDILTAYNVIEGSIENQVLILENVIIGEIPSTYYNLEGIQNQNDLLSISE